MKISIIIVAGGSGSRMGAAIPKQFLLLNKLPILMHTIQKFYDALPHSEIIVCLPKQELDNWAALCKEYNFTIAHKMAIGGASRAESVLNGIQITNAKANDIIAIHDGVRPIISKNLIQKLVLAAQEFGSAIPYVPCVDTTRMLNNKGVYEMIDRNTLRMIQTPQCFEATILKKSYLQKDISAYTDDASIVEANGFSLHFEMGEKNNIKITTPEDLDFATYLGKREL